MHRIQELRGHTARVLHLTQNPSGTQLCSASADETIRFWDISVGSSAATGTGKASRDGLNAHDRSGGSASKRGATAGSGSAQNPGSATMSRKRSGQSSSSTFTACSLLGEGSVNTSFSLR